MILQYSPDGHLLYVKLREREIAETAEIEDDVYVDLDPDGRAVGIEFLNADGSFPFLARIEPRPEAVVEVPGALDAMIERRLEQRTTPERAVDA